MISTLSLDTVLYICTTKNMTWYKYKQGLGAGCFGSLEPEPEPIEKKTGAEARAAWKKSQEPEPQIN